MIRQKLIPGILALLVIGAMTLSDYGHLVFELDKFAERVKIENEELEEDSEIKHWLKLIISGDPSPMSSEESYHLQVLLAGHDSYLEAHFPLFPTNTNPFYIQYCSLKIHLS